MRKRRGRDRRETRIATSPRGRGKRKENEGFREAWGWMMAGEAVGRGRAERVFPRAPGDFANGGAGLGEKGRRKVNEFVSFDWEKRNSQ